MTNQPELMTIDEAASYLRVVPQTVYRLMTRGALPGVKVGHQWRIRRADLEAYIRGDGQPQGYAPRKQGQIED